MTAMKTLFATLLLSFAALAAHAAGLSLPDYETITLENGTRVLLLRKPDVPMVAARVLVRGGALADAAGKEGSAALLADLLGKGAGTRDALAFANAAESVGGEISFAADREAVWASADFLARDTDLMLELLSDALQRPTLAPAEFEKLRTRSIQAMAAAKDGDPRGLVDTYGEAWLFRGHPYGRPVSGDENTLAAITLDDLKSYYRDQLGGDRTTVAITGDFDPAAMRGKLEHAFGGWRKAAGTLPVVSPKLRENARRVLLVDKPGATQTYFWAGNVGSPVNDPAREAQDLVQTVFGGRFTSMLNTELRIKSGLSYGARAGIDRLAQPGAAAFVSFTRTDATAQALELAFATLDRLHKDGVDAETLASAKRYVLGQFAPDYETAAQLAGAIARLDLYGLPRDYVDGYGARIEAASAADVAAARSAFAPGESTVLVAIGDASKIRDAVAKYGPVTEMKLSDKGFVPK
jgi:predicted Zn-dependent peptidase